VTSHRFCVAPMLDWTDRHCRFFHRLLSQRTLLYSEMVTTGAILHGDRERLLGFNPVEKPLVLQIGGSDPSDLAASARIGQDFGYDEINLNVGCPSDRVQKGRFGACLMLEPDTVAEGVQAMREAVALPVTVKTRLGVDEHDSYEELVAFIGRVAEAGCDTFIIHARKAWLKGLSPRENREVPPLRYDMAARLKADFPDRAFILNGGIETLDDAVKHLGQFDGVMLGRAAYHDPYLLADVDRRVFGVDREPPSREAVVEAMLPYIEAHVAEGQRLHGISRHMLGLFHGQHGGRIWRRRLGEAAIRPNAGAKDLLEILTSRRPRSHEGDAGLGV